MMMRQILKAAVLPAVLAPVLLLAQTVPNYTIKTVAGNGTAGF